MTTDLRGAARGKPLAPLPEDPAPVDETDNARIAFEYFKGQGLTDEQAAGVVGNFDVEAPGVNPDQHQFGNGPGRGIGQWEVGNRWDTIKGDNVVDFAAGENKSATSLQAQLDFTWYELNKFPYMGLSDLRSATSVEEATKVFQDEYERPNKATPNTAERLARAKAAFAAFGGSRQITQGEDSVRVGTALQPAAHVGSPDSGGGQIAEGHPNVLIGTSQMPFARVGDRTKIRSGMVVDGDDTVLLGGDAGSGGPGDGGPGEQAPP